MYGIITELYPRLKYPHLVKGLVGAWSPSLGNTGPILIDRSGRGNHGILVNMDPVTDWVVNNNKLALDFDGSVGGVNLPVKVVSRQFDNLTISFWFYNRAYNEAPLLCQNGGASILCFRAQFYNSGAFARRFQCYAGAVVIGSQETLNVWTHWVLTYQSGTLIWYENGRILGTSTGTGPAIIATTPDYFNFGHGDFGTCNALLDELLIYDRALHGTEIIELYSINRGNFLQLKSKNINTYISSSILSTTTRRCRRIPSLSKHPLIPTI